MMPHKKEARYQLLTAGHRKPDTESCQTLSKEVPMFAARYKELFTPYFYSVMSIGYAELFNRKVSIISVFGSENFHWQIYKKNNSVYLSRVQNYNAGPSLYNKNA